MNLKMNNEYLEKNIQEHHDKSVMRIYKINDKQRAIMAEWHKLEEEKQPFLDFVLMVQPYEKILNLKKKKKNEQSTKNIHPVDDRKKI